jgi:hypothetical protein
MPDPLAPGKHLLVANDLVQQALDNSSKLRAGKITSNIIKVEVRPSMVCNNRTMAATRNEIASELAVEKERRIGQARRIVRRMLCLQLAKAFDWYLGQVDETKRLRDASKSLLLRIQHRTTYAVFDMFCCRVSQLRLGRQVVEKAVRRLRSSAKSTALWVWMEYIARAAQEKQEAALADIVAHMKARVAFLDRKLEGAALEIADLDRQFAVAQLELFETRQKCKVCSHENFNLRITELEPAYHRENYLR